MTEPSVEDRLVFALLSRAADTLAAVDVLSHLSVRVRPHVQHITVIHKLTGLDVLGTLSYVAGLALDDQVLFGRRASVVLRDDVTKFSHAAYGLPLSVDVDRGGVAWTTWFDSTGYAHKARARRASGDVFVRGVDATLTPHPPLHRDGDRLLTLPDGGDEGGHWHDVRSRYQALSPPKETPVNFRFSSSSPAM